MKSKLCGRGHNNWGTWTSTSGKISRYCKDCQRLRAIKYSKSKRNANGRHTKKEFLDKLKLYPHCPRCKRKWSDIPYSKGGAKYRITEDHIVPLLKGGSDNIENIQPLCYECNFKKGHK